MEAKDKKSTNSVQSIRFHIAVQIKNVVYSSVESEKHKLSMTSITEGVRIKGAGINMLVPYSNIHSLYYYAEEISSK